MTERTRNGKSFAQDATGFVFCLVGGFFAVSIVQALRGHEPKESMEAVTRPVLGLVAGLGSPAALVFAVGLAALGTTLFLRTSAVAPLRPLGALVLGALGSALLLGAFGAGGSLGAWLPGLVGGFVGRAIGVTLGAALAWLGWTLAFQPHAPRESAAEAIQRIGLSSRQDAAGVSPAEAALLVSETRPVPKAAPAARPAAVARREEPLRTETLQPGASPGENPAAAAPSSAAPSAPLDPDLTVQPPAPSWEAGVEEEPAREEAEASPVARREPLAEPGAEPEPEPEPDDEEAGLEEERDPEPLATLRASRAEVFSVGDAEGPADDEVEDEVDDDEDDATEAYHAEPLEEDEPDREDAPAAEPALPAAAWEQVGLFDELEEPAPKPAASERTPSFDFEAPERAPAPVASAPRPPRAPAPDAGPFASPREAEGAPAPAPAPDYTLTPSPRPAPVVARDEEEERWAQLVYESGCLILEQKRVAVSMLERRFGIDFDRACKVLDELQQAGLIGPYIGGRSRDILLTREEWLPHAPHAS